ncbi:uncharacterized protein LOC120848794 [Ixodes scapularis]|uniref:uncharacterized protein LOC120848794 n=1 Tax=Ixodes scapularis TaxID=6945 RepID=UPI001A9F4201|nr:uncharacterized protein LOC120848794 [Ixodes scapularis]
MSALSSKFFMILDEIKKNNDFPNISRATLCRVLNKLGFAFTTRKRNSLLLERNDLVLWRASYLRSIKEYRQDNRPIYYLDETWVNAEHTRSKNPSGKGERLIIVHAGSKEGFLVGAAEVFRAKKGIGDYHQEMDGQRFEEWFTKKLLPNLKPRSVVVMDNASYRFAKIHTLPTTSTKKLEIRQWLSNNGIASDMSMLKVELLNLVSKAKAARAELEKYRIDTIAEHHGHSVLRLPPYHCKLNPIELVRSQVKGEVASKNQSFKIAGVEKLTPTALQNVSPETWESYVKHAIQVEEQMWEADGLVDTVLDSIVIDTNGDSDTDTCDEDEEMGCEPLEW